MVGETSGVPEHIPAGDERLTSAPLWEALIDFLKVLIPQLREADETANQGGE